MSTLLVLPKLQVQKANAFSSAYSVGFPAMTAWHGFVHALERLLNQSGFDIQLPQLGVVTYGVDVHRHKDRGDRIYSLKDQGKPLKSDASRPSAVESATCDLTVTVIAKIQGEYDEQLLIKTVQRLLLTKLRCCSGVIVNNHKPWLKEIASDSDWFWLRRILMPGQAIISRQDLLQTSMEQTNDAIESMIQCLG
ncbi:type I-F CRISPR-associated protein Csy2, partial [Vibrio rotiferianus]